MPRRETFRRFSGWAFLSFVFQLLLATVGSLIVGTLVALIPSAILAAIAQNASGGSFVDHVIDQPFFRWADNSNVLVILSAFALGTLASRVFRPRVGGLVWILPTTILLWNLFTWEGAGAFTRLPYWTAVWNNYFAECGSSECLYKLFVTVPFYSSLAYSVGWICERLLPRSHAMRVRGGWPG